MFSTTMLGTHPTLPTSIATKHSLDDTRRRIRRDAKCCSGINPMKVTKQSTPYEQLLHVST